MNINPETDLDLEKLFLPAWAQESSSVNRFAKFAGGEDRPDRRDDHRGGGQRPPRRDGGARGPGGPRRDDRTRSASGPRRADAPGRPPHEDRGGPRRDDRREPREALPPPPEVNVSLVPDEKGVESLARQIKVTGRAYPLFDIARLILQKPERYGVRFSIQKNAEGQPVQPLFVCALDETLWLTEDEAVAHVLQKHFTTFYQAERTATEPPKGKYTFVAQCGLSGVILGPPNHHDYQNRLHKLHTERFARMPFEAYKARIKIVRDEEVVKKWVDDQSWKTEYVCLNVPEPLKLAGREDVEHHFRAVHKDTIIKPTDAHTVSGVAARAMRCHGLARLAREVSDDQRRFPLQMATGLSQQFAQHGLQFFKVNKTVTHVSVARPHFLDLETTPVSDGVKRIVEYINAHPKCTRRKLMEALAPSPAPKPIPIAPVEGEASVAASASDATAAAPRPTEPPEPTPEQTAVIGDLHWLIHQGHVIEFANGAMDTAKKPLPRPPKLEKKPAPASVESATLEGTVDSALAEETTAVAIPSAESELSAGADLPVDSVPEVEEVASPLPAPASEERPAASV